MLRFAWKSALFLVFLSGSLLAFVFMLKVLSSGWREAMPFLPDAIFGMALIAAAIWLLALLGVTVFKVADVIETRRVKALHRTIGDLAEARYREL